MRPSSKRSSAAFALSAAGFLFLVAGLQDIRVIPQYTAQTNAPVQKITIKKLDEHAAGTELSKAIAALDKTIYEMRRGDKNSIPLNKGILTVDSLLYNTQSLIVNQLRQGHPAYFKVGESMMYRPGQGVVFDVGQDKESHAASLDTLVGALEGERNYLAFITTPYLPSYPKESGLLSTKKPRGMTTGLFHQTQRGYESILQRLTNLKHALETSFPMEFEEIPVTLAPEPLEPLNSYDLAEAGTKLLSAAMLFWQASYVAYFSLPRADKD